MCTTTPAGNGGRCRFIPAALPVRADSSVQLCVVGAAAALCGALVLTGAGLPLVEWFALPERFEDMKHRPRAFGPHFAAFLLALCGLDLVNDLAGVVRQGAPGRARRRLCVIAVKAVMLLSLVTLSAGASLSSSNGSSSHDGVVALASSEYAGQWGELAVGVVGNLLLLSVACGSLPARVTTSIESRRAASSGQLKSEFDSQTESNPTPVNALTTLDC